MSILERLLYNFVRPFAPDWFADRYRTQHAAAMRAFFATEIVSKIGVHCVGGNRTGFGAFLQRINNAGHKLSVITAYDDFGAPWECKQLWPDCLTVGMLTNTDFGFNYAAFVKKAKQNPWVDYWAVLNEIDGRYADQANLYIDLLPRMAADGLRLGMFSCASGTPKLPSEDGGAAYAEITRACKFASDNHYDALLLVHEYRGAGQIDRYKSLRNHLVDHNAIIPIVISEWGDETFRGTPEMMQLVRDSDPLYMPDEWLEGCANWTLGGGGWAGSNYAKALPELGEYIATVEAIAPPPTEMFTASVTMHNQYRAELTAYVTERGGTIA